ncbi:MAG: OmpA family protein [Planctomycetes bacterium]|nr:OmpA family protein [Planctomycetota bacterium]
MTRTIATLAVVVAAAMTALGCAGAKMDMRLQELSREREDLIRRNTTLEAQLAASEAREAELKRDMASRKASAPAGPEMTLPEDLKGRGIQLRRRGNDTVIDLPSDVFFASGSSKLTTEGERTLAKVADMIRSSYRGSMIRVEGHADSDPIRRTKSKYHCNWDLSFERAHAVVHYLIEKAKFDPRHLVADCYGEYQPVDPKNKAKNRRVEIVVAR